MVKHHWLDNTFRPVGQSQPRATASAWVIKSGCSSLRNVSIQDKISSKQRIFPYLYLSHIMWHREDFPLTKRGCPAIGHYSERRQQFRAVFRVGPSLSEAL